MTAALYLVILFFAKVLDNTLGTAKTILVQRNRCVLAGVALGLSNFIYLSITKDIVTSDSSLASPPPPRAPPPPAQDRKSVV